MIRSMLAWPVGKLIQGAEVVWKESFTGGEIREFLEASLTQHQARLVAWQSDGGLDDAVHDVQEALQLAPTINFAAPALPADHESVARPSLMAGGFSKLLSRGKVIEGAAEALSAVVDDCELSADFCREMDRIIRHIEIRRQDCLPGQGDGDGQQRDLVRARVSVALLTYGQRQNDLRFLNSAMKLNDWLLMRHRKSAPSPTTAKLLYALMLQEVTVSGLTTCA